MSVGEIIEELRRDAGMTQQQVGDLLNVGNSAVYGYESGKSNPSPEALAILADYFNVSVDYILGRTRIRLPWNEFFQDIETDNGPISVDTVVKLLRYLDKNNRTLIINLLEQLSIKTQLENKDTSANKKNKKK